jgi:glycosyltransferase involved in cell wall biosynthesis
VLSILIPVYNINCYPLVASLLQQLEETTYHFEIICIDDASTKKFDEHKKFNEIDNVTFTRLKENVGRSRIRNILASSAKYEWLLFLDADTLPTKSNFIEKYFNYKNTKPTILVVSGGLAYNQSDTKIDTSLRFKYGKSRESISPQIRNRTPYTSLLMSNTLIHKSIFEKVQFSNKISLYGHEDTVFSYDLYTHKINVIHTNNPVYHTGLENNMVFINKSKIAIENLWNLYLEGLMKPEINKLLKWSLRLRKWRIHSIFSLLYTKFHLSFEKALSKKNPSLLLFDIYRLSYLCSISNKKN